MRGKEERKWEETKLTTEQKIERLWDRHEIENLMAKWEEYSEIMDKA